MKSCLPQFIPALNARLKSISVAQPLQRGRTPGERWQSGCRTPCSLLSDLHAFNRRAIQCKVMSRAPESPIHLGGQVFFSQFEAGAHFKTMLCSYEVGQVVSDPNDVKDLEELLNVHPKRVEKIGSGIRHFMVRATEEGEYAVKTRFFSIVRTDGSHEDFSYVKCIRQLFWDTDRAWNAPVAADAGTEGGLVILKNLDGALRRAVLEQRTAYVEERFRDALRIDGAPPRCDRTGVTLHEPEACLVAYEKPGMFATLRYDWLVNEGISATEVKFTPNSSQEPPKLVDLDQAARWRKFHWQNAKLKLVSKEMAHQESRQLGRQFEPGSRGQPRAKRR